MNPDSSPALWYYAHEGQSFGPLPFEELQGLLAEGTISEETLVVQEGSEDWQPFARYLSPPVPAAAQHEAGEESGHAVGAGGRPQRPVSRRAQAIYEAQRQRTQRIRNGCAGCLMLVLICGGLMGLLVRCMDGEKELSVDELRNPQAAVEKLMKAVYQSDLRETSATEIAAPDPAAGKLNVYVRVNARGNLTEHMMRRGMEFKMTDAYKALYKSSLPIWEVTIWNYAKLTDRYGKESEEIVYKTTLHSREASRINWQNADAVAFENLWEVNYLHPTFKDE